MKTKFSNVKGLIAAVMMTAFSLLAIPSQARADQPAVSARSPGAQPRSVSEPIARTPPSMTDTYGARESNSKSLAGFKGGHRGVIVASSTVVVVLLVVLIILLL